MDAQWVPPLGPVGTPDTMGISTKGNLYTYIHTYLTSNGHNEKANSSTKHDLVSKRHEQIYTAPTNPLTDDIRHVIQQQRNRIY